MIHDITSIPKEGELSERKALPPGPTCDVDDTYARVESVLEDWQLLWEFINGVELRKLIDVTLYAEGVKLHKQTKDLLKLFEEEKKVITQAVIDIKNTPVTEPVVLPVPWLNQFCAKCWRPRDPHAWVCPLPCGCRDFQTVKTANSKDGKK